VVIVPLTASSSGRAEQHGFLRRRRLATVIAPEAHCADDSIRTSVHDDDLGRGID
jgi:hypothetical protein